MRCVPGGMGCVPGGKGGAVPSSLRMAAGGTAGSAPYLSAAAALCAATCPSGDRATHSAASSGGGEAAQVHDLAVAAHP